MAWRLIERSRQGVDVFQRPVNDKLSENDGFALEEEGS